MSQTVEFTVPDMTCGHCAGRIEALVAGLDAKARVDIDLPGHRVRIESDTDAEVFRAALIEADYPPA
ncbi:heavy-metal-associated domain-containing protein [Methyloversatilis thermotolerans]|uniref:heavy-metal-associated domain-containing protein n=1 Tax=Methyloversatilis thermotolerans TaxID=1346290 RepID=UPI00036030D7|nr:heavy-metal-associated domain-containing protein [Methyloversatilis thermotolerans]